MCIGLAALSGPFLAVYFGSEYLPSQLPLLLLLPGTLGFAIARPIFSIGQGSGTLRPLIIASSIAAIGNLGLNVLLIPRYGMIGAGIATSIGYSSMLFLHAIMALQVGFNPFSDIRAVPVLTTVILSAPIIYAVANITGFGIISLIVTPPIGGFVFGTLAIATRSVDPQEVLSVVRPLPDIVQDTTMRYVFAVSQIRALRFTR